MHHRSPLPAYDRVYTGRKAITISNCLFLDYINRRNRTTPADPHPSPVRKSEPSPTVNTPPLTLPRTESRPPIYQIRYVRLPWNSPGSLYAFSHSYSRASDLIASERNYGSDVENLPVRRWAQQNRLESTYIRRREIPVCTRANPGHQTEIVGMLRQLYVLLDQFLAVKRKYGLQPSQTMQLLLGDGDTGRVCQLSRADTTAAF